MVGLEAITEVTEKRPQLQGTAQELARKQRVAVAEKANPGAKPREAARPCWIVPFFDSLAEVHYAPQPLLRIRLSPAPAEIPRPSTRIFSCRFPRFSSQPVSSPLASAAAALSPLASAAAALQDRSLLSSGIVGALLSAALYRCWTAVGWRSA